MALLNEILVGRFNRAIIKMFGLKGPSPSSQVASEIIPIVKISSGVETFFLEGWTLFGGQFYGNAVAAQNSAVQFRNPAGSNMMAVLMKLRIEENAADPTGPVGWLGDDVTIPNMTAIFSGSMDNRVQKYQSAAGGGLLQPSAGNNQANPAGAGAFTLFNPYMATANTPVDLISTHDQEILLPPGSALKFISTAVNLQMRIIATWRERFLEDSERQ